MSDVGELNKPSAESWLVEEKDESLYNGTEEKGVWRPKADVILSMFQTLSAGGSLPLAWVCPGRRAPEAEGTKQEEEEMEAVEEEGPEATTNVPEATAFDFDETESDGSSKITPRRTPGGNVRTPRTEKRVARMDNIMDSLRRQQMQRAAEKEARKGRGRLLNFAGNSPGSPRAGLSNRSSPGSASPQPVKPHKLLSTAPRIAIGNVPQTNASATTTSTVVTSNSSVTTTCASNVSDTNKSGIESKSDTVLLPASITSASSEVATAVSKVKDAVNTTSTEAVKEHEVGSSIVNKKTNAEPKPPISTSLSTIQKMEKAVSETSTEVSVPKNNVTTNYPVISEESKTLTTFSAVGSLPELTTPDKIATTMSSLAMSSLNNTSLSAQTVLDKNLESSPSILNPSLTDSVSKDSQKQGSETLDSNAVSVSIPTKAPETSKPAEESNTASSMEALTHIEPTLPLESLIKVVTSEEKDTVVNTKESEIKSD